MLAVHTLDDVLFNQPIVKTNNRPRGRTAGALECNVPDISYKDVRKSCSQFLNKNGNNFKFGATIEGAIANVHQIVHSEHVRAIHRSEYSHRTKYGINRDIAAWIVLLSTVHLTASGNDKWFRCAVNLEGLNDLVGYLSLSRASRFLDFYRWTDLLKVKYKQSNQSEQKYCEIYISREAFYLAGVTPLELDEEIERKRKNDATKLARAGTRVAEEARAAGKKINREMYKTETAVRRKKKQQASDAKQAANEKFQNNEAYNKAIEQLVHLKNDYPGMSLEELQAVLIKYNPSYTKFFKPPH